ncbi:Ribosomal Protein, Large subunit family member (rpl-22) [Reticulomyxa filosa]|uniref:Large ribosomal subunit protein eL22 n=1 Tax=Reticulomyxa filosa TaxID=46433 RepID=X6MUB6_RETFI|nr:Ribosomal Protein, Large subunit family member (rpl-22) [Reticulomyxa filosa]|eukprot:ETO17384.1 Ribosomal Protein, Large subunit family member (rpl-22) [Reticulomyxa filosa]
MICILYPPKKKGHGNDQKLHLCNQNKAMSSTESATAPTDNKAESAEKTTQPASADDSSKPVSKPEKEKKGRRKKGSPKSTKKPTLKDAKKKAEVKKNICKHKNIPDKQANKQKKNKHGKTRRKKTEERKRARIRNGILRREKLAARRAKSHSKFQLRCKKPVEDEIFDVDEFVKFLTEKFKINGKTGNVGAGKDSNIQKSGSSVHIQSKQPFPKYYIKVNSNSITIHTLFCILSSRSSTPFLFGDKKK